LKAAVEAEINEVIRNVIRDTRRKIKYVIYASRKLTRLEMLSEIKYFNFDPLNIKQKPGTTVEINSML
jgi:hypothetical protein